ncbi:MAG: chemotaxis protein CheW [Granulosicoccaceae bacterium]|jgi:chemosensory pili system protein ChpC
MSTVQATVASQMIPLEGEHLLLPNTAIAEIIGHTKAEPLPDSLKNTPDWLIGMLAWRGVSIPLVSLETLMGGKIAEPSPRARIAVINAIGGKAKSAFFAVATQGIPRLVSVSKERINPVDDNQQSGTGVHCHVVIDGETAMIPNIEEIETQLARVFKASGK